MLADLARRGINELHVEAGHKLNGSFVREGLVDEFLVYMAPKLLGIGRELAAFGPLRAAAGQRWTCASSASTALGDDLRLIACARPGATLATRSRRLRQCAACSPASSPASAASSTSTPLGSDAAHGKRLHHRDAGRLPRRRAARRQHRAQRCLHDGHHARPRRRAASASTSRPRAWTRPPGSAEPGAVNLEKALRANDRLGGHLVSGHVDGIGRVAHFAAGRRVVGAAHRRAARRWRASWPTRARSPSTA